MKRSWPLLLLLAACQSEDAPAPLAQFPGIAAVTVEMPEDTNFEYALSAAMGARDLPTYFGADGPAASHHLKIERAAAGLHLELSDPQHAPIDAFDQPVLVDQALLARKIAERVAGKLIPEGPAIVQPAAAHIAILPGDGAKGDGNDALARALRQMLTGKVAVDDAPSTANYSIAVKVVQSRERDHDRISLTWKIADPKGREIAHLSQSNNVAAGSLDHAWGPVAYDAALAAAQMLVPLIRKLPAEPPS